MNFKIFAALFFMGGCFTTAQNFQFSGNFTAKGIVFSADESPFWFHNNQRGRLNEISNISTFASGLIRYQFSENSRFLIGAGVLYQDGYLDGFQLDESFIGFENSWLEITAGRRQMKELYKGLSATNENILWSLNARPLPGISIKTTRPVYFLPDAGLAFEAGLEEFITDDDRFVRDVRIHHKSFNLIFSKIRNFEFNVGLHHFVQWAGTSPEFGKLPGSFEDYLRVVSGMGTGEEIGGGNEVNGLGNHLGSYIAGIKTSVGNYNINIIYNHLFEDGSGMRLGNTPDGRYSLFIEDEKPGKWIDAFMYEFYYTKHQSFTSSGTDGKDNYFNNNLYRSGWTYENRILGLPFIFLDEDRFRVANNNVVAHHIGLSGIAFSSFPYKVLSRYRQNYGAKGGGNLRNKILSTYLDLNIYNTFVDVNLLVGADFNNTTAPNFGAGLQLTKNLF